MYFVDDKVAGSPMPTRQDLARWRQLGIKTVITLAEPHELEEHGWTPIELGQALAEEGMAWIHWPTPDGRAPRDLPQLARLIARRAALGRVVVHCVAGVGRTATALAAYLAAVKCMDPDDAIRRLSELAPIALSEEQYYAVLEAADCGPPRAAPGPSAGQSI